MSLPTKSPAAVVSDGAIKSTQKYNNDRNTNSQEDNFEAVNKATLPFIAGLLRRWLPDGVVRGNEYMARNPKRTDGRVGSFKINVLTGRWADFATGDAGGDIISLAAYLFNLSQKEAKRRISEMLGGGHAQ